MQRLSAVAVPVLLLVIAAPAVAQYQIPESVISSGGRDMDGASHRIRGTIGQTAIGPIVGVSYRMEIGFWQGYQQLVSPVEDTPIYIWNLQQNHPNPFNPRTTVSFSLPEAAQVRLRIYDVRGGLVRTLVDGQRGAGDHAEVWNGRDDNGAGVSSGVYFARLESTHGILTRKMTLTR